MNNSDARRAQVEVVPTAASTARALLDRALANRLALPNLAAAAVVFPAKYRLRAEGRPETVEEYTKVTGRSEEEITALLGQAPGFLVDPRGQVCERDEPALPTYRVELLDRRQTIEVGGCAAEAMFVPIVLREVAPVVSACRATGEPVSVTIGADGGLREVRPGSAVIGVIIEIDPDRPRLSTCPDEPFFVSEQAASGWLAEHAHDGAVIPVSEAVSRLRLLPGRVPPARCQ